ncbi:ribulose bisphosphate carboxylase small subunit, chloroplastic-like [Pyrus x bretschneideri]|uniref:ribulose bisphosphate carboxylase small subunit, chloroplastic-like n=1 Tax=Pyrus x bretschneideri TaxID=225117 RepID=UPI002030C3B4|nr:ribulose bisphosphate carboxylase small subunit, chloroplastic-like [Pyrus x bretschneideri]
MASSMISSATVSTVYAGRAAPTQASMVAPGLKSSSAFPITRKNNDITSIASNGGRVQCIVVQSPVGLKKFETLNLPPLSPESLAKEVDYLLRNNWVPCLEFELETGFVYRENHKSPGYYDGSYWKLPILGCTDSSQVLKKLEEAKKAYPNSFIRIIGFDNVRQVQCISFLAYKPPGY